MGIHVMTPYYMMKIKGKLYTTTFYPDYHVESTSVDGIVLREVSDIGWASLHDGAGTAAHDADLTVTYFIWIEAGFDPAEWRVLYRLILLFDTSTIPPGAEIVSATLSVYGGTKLDNGNILPAMNVYASNPASNTALVAADYQTLGTTPFSIEIGYASYNESGWNDFVLNTAGKAAIAKGGITKLGLRESKYDAPDIAPDWTANITARIGIVSSDSAYLSGHLELRPALTVTYKI